PALPTVVTDAIGNNGARQPLAKPRVDPEVRRVVARHRERDVGHSRCSDDSGIRIHDDRHRKRWWAGEDAHVDGLGSVAPAGVTDLEVVRDPALEREPRPEAAG